MRPLAVLRPEPGATSTLNRARAEALDAFVVPLFRIECLDWAVPDAARFDALLLTSANAVRCAGAELRRIGLKAYAVGPATADAAKAAGLEIEAVGTGGVEVLLPAIPAGLRLLHPCGEDRRVPAASDQSITSVAVYRSAEVPSPPEIQRIEGAVALVHSPRAGRRLDELLQEKRHTVIAAISVAAAQACGTGWENVEVAQRPTDEALLSLAARLCKHSQPE